MSPAMILHLRFHRVSREAYGQVFTALADITPTVQSLPPDAALLDVTGALNYFGRSPAGIADLLQTRILARYGLQVTVGGGPNRMLATMAAHACPTGSVRILPATPRAVTEFLAELPVGELPGVGPVLTRAFTSYGLTSIGDLQALPMTTMQRIAGASTGRQLYERALGNDPRPVEPGGPPAGLHATRRFVHDTLDPTVVCRALLALATDLGSSLRASEQAARMVELQVRFADRSATTRSRTLREASNHTPAIQDALYGIFSSLGLQRARIRVLAAHADRLVPAEWASVQLTLDRPTEHARQVEPTIDRANARYGPGTLRPASLANTPVALCKPGHESRDGSRPRRFLPGRRAGRPVARSRPPGARSPSCGGRRR
jgi:DNA polymerase-4